MTDFFILIISTSAFSQPVDLKIEYYDFIYAYSGDYVNIIGKLTNTGDINYKDISITVKLYDKENRLISREKIVVPYILSRGNCYFKKMSP
ncbi:MAG: FxLYD domain-containing protein [Candidatus Marinimicrobia bacterium]|nr:FxLYD domain-containing protein [Candidatus Neomarinimicrobiota bacterium]